MSHWNYRVCKETYSKGTQDEEVSFTIREAYYNDAGDIWAVTEEAKGVSGESIADIEQCIKWMQLAINKDVLDIDTLVFAKSDTGIE